MKIVCVIPARYHSTRLPGKPLAQIAGKPMIQHVYERASLADEPDEVLVATDSRQVYDAVKAFGGRVALTSPDHATGTDRLAEVAASLDDDVEIIVNVQGDEPLIAPEVIDRLAAELRRFPEIVMATLAAPLEADEYDAPAAVKVVADRAGYALYFSRSLVPYPRNPSAGGGFYKHIGVYAYRRDFLIKFAALPQTPLEKTESLEQLRALEHGYRIKVLNTDFKSIGVDTPEDLARVNALLAGQGGCLVK